MQHTCHRGMENKSTYLFDCLIVMLKILLLLADSSILGQSMKSVIDERVRLAKASGMLRKCNINTLDRRPDRFHDSEQERIRENKAEKKVLGNLQMCDFGSVRKLMHHDKVSDDNDGPSNTASDTSAHVSRNIVVNNLFDARLVKDQCHITSRHVVALVVCRNVAHWQIRESADKASRASAQPSSYSRQYCSVASSNLHPLKPSLSSLCNESSGGVNLANLTPDELGQTAQQTTLSDRTK